MSKPRTITTIFSLMLTLGLAFFLFGGFVDWSVTLIYLLHIFLAIYFFAVLVSNQQYEEDKVAQGERVLGAVLFSYVILIQLVYAPIARYYFETLIGGKFFLSDLLALFLFMFFLFLFFTSTFVLNSFAKGDFLSGWSLFNNPTAYFVLRNLFLPALLLVAFLFWQMPFIIISV